MLRGRRGLRWRAERCRAAAAYVRSLNRAGDSSAMLCATGDTGAVSVPLGRWPLALPRRRE